MKLSIGLLVAVVLVQAVSGQLNYLRNVAGKTGDLGKEIAKPLLGLFGNRRNGQPATAPNEAPAGKPAAAHAPTPAKGPEEDEKAGPAAQKEEAMKAESPAQLKAEKEEEKKEAAAEDAKDAGKEAEDKKAGPAAEIKAEKEEEKKEVAAEGAKDGPKGVDADAPLGRTITGARVNATKPPPTPAPAKETEEPKIEGRSGGDEESTPEMTTAGAATEPTTPAPEEASPTPIPEETSPMIATEAGPTEAEAGPTEAEAGPTEAEAELPGEGEEVSEETTNENLPLLRTYDELDFNGEFHNYSVASPPKCQRLRHAAKSLVTYGTCVDLFVTPDCSGDEQVRLSEQAGGFFHDVTRLNPVGVTGDINSAAQSFRACPEIKDKSQQVITVFKEKDMVGQSEKLTLTNDQCVDLGPLADEVSSIDVKDSCIELFLLYSCVGPSIRVFPGTQFPHSDLSSVLFAKSTKPLEDNAQSVRRCTVTRKDHIRPKPESGAVEFFSQHDLEGVSEVVDLSPEGSCHNLDLKPRSVKTNENCVLVFQETGCIGSSRHVFPGAEFPHKELAGVSFIPSYDDLAENAKSAKLCSMP